MRFMVVLRDLMGFYGIYSGNDTWLAGGSPRKMEVSFAGKITNDIHGFEGIFTESSGERVLGDQRSELGVSIFPTNIPYVFIFPIQ